MAQYKHPFVHFVIHFRLAYLEFLDPGLDSAMEHLR